MTHEQNRDHWRELLPIIQAFINGDPVQYQATDGTWMDVQEDPKFSMHPSRYRTKRKPRKVWINEYPGDAFIAYNDRDLADNRANKTYRIACHEVELPPAP